jgi:hypothetical protein
MRLEPLASAAFRDGFALYLAPVNREASFRIGGVVRIRGARYVQSNAAVRRELAVFPSHAVWLITSAGPVL